MKKLTLLILLVFNVLLYSQIPINIYVDKESDPDGDGETIESAFNTLYKLQNKINSLPRDILYDLSIYIKSYPQPYINSYSSNAIINFPYNIQIRKLSIQNYLDDHEQVTLNALNKNIGIDATISDLLGRIDEVIIKNIKVEN